jgi:hypothetical protein
MIDDRRRTCHQYRDVILMEYSCGYQPLVHERLEPVCDLLGMESHEIKQDRFDVEVVRVLDHGSWIQIEG